MHGDGDGLFLVIKVLVAIIVFVVIKIIVVIVIKVVIKIIVVIEFIEFVIEFIVVIVIKVIKIIVIKIIKIIVVKLVFVVAELVFGFFLFATFLTGLWESRNDRRLPFEESPIWFWVVRQFPQLYFGTNYHLPILIM
ncbi:MAG: hypothetical protein ACFCD0_21100 [Gemmataceae bacterium]